MDIRQLSGALGAEVRGIDLEDTDAATIRQLVLDHLVVTFPDQHLSVGGQLRLAESLGDVIANTFTQQADPAHPGVTVHRAADGYVADVWHSDGQPQPAPVKFTMLHMLEVPERGGDTVWTNQCRVFEKLSPPLQVMLRELTALQRSLVNPNEESTHPAVIEHPETGRELLYVSRAHTVRFLELTLAESRALLAHLFDIAQTPEFTCRYRWTPGTVGLWDNVATVHYAVNDYDEPRSFNRVMVAGPVLPERVSHWPDAADTRQRVLRRDGATSVVGAATEKLWQS